MSEDGYFGLFEGLRRLQLPGLAATDLYEGFNAALYDQAVGQDRSDVEAVLAFVRRGGGPVLELCCGSGRLAVPIAETGLQVWGVDSSADMLKLLRQQLTLAPPEVAARIHAEGGDVRDLQLGRRFPSVLLGATTMCLFRTPEDRRALLGSVVRHLEPAGEFAFDYLETSPAILERQEREFLVLPLSGRNVTGGFTIIGRRHDREARAQILNFFSELFERNGRTARFLGTSTKAILDWSELEGEIREAGLSVVERTEMLRPTERDEETGEVQWLVRCRLR